jgi:dienelactone hydrolase
MTPFFQDLGEYSDLAIAAERSQPLFPLASPGPQTQERVREVLNFAPGDEQPQDVQVMRRWEKDGISGEEITWSVGYGPRTYAWLLKPLGASGKMPGVLALHDHGGFKFYGKEKIADGPDDTPEVLHKFREAYGNRAFANELARRGCAVLVPDVFLWGSRKFAFETIPKDKRYVAKKLLQDEPYDLINEYNHATSLHEEVVEKYCRVLGTCLAAVVSYEDRIAANYLASLDDVGSIGCVGLSGGGARSGLLQATCDKIQAAVIVGMMSTYSGLLDHNIVSHTWMLFPEGWARYGDYPDLVACRAPSPLLVQYDEDDPLFTLDGMRGADARFQTLYESTDHPENYTGQFYPGTHKFDVPMQEAAFDWLLKALR